jgi:hypothetical protein
VKWVHPTEDGPAAGPYEHGNETSGSIKGEKFIDWHSDYQLLKKALLLRVSQIAETNCDL